MRGSRPPGGIAGRWRRPDPPLDECDCRRDPLRSTRPVRRAPRLVGRRRLGRSCCSSRCPFAPRVAGPAERRRLHPRRPRVGAGQGAPRDRARRAAVGARRRLLSSDDARGRHAGVRGRRGRGDPRHRRRRRTSPASSRTCSRRARSRPTATPPTTSSSSTCRRTTRPTPADPARAPRDRRPGSTVELAGGPAFYGDVQTVSEADLQRSELISLPLAALALLLVFGSLVAAGVPLVVGGAAVVVALAAHLPGRLGHADEHLRAQPRDAARARARRRLLAAA